MASLIRLVPGPLGTPEYVQLKPGIELALDRILLSPERKLTDDVIRDYNSLKNLSTLIK